MTNPKDKTLVPVEQVELLPCPFCGTKDDRRSGVKNGVTVIDVPEVASGHAAYSVVECGQCVTLGSPAGTREQAIAAWNTRSSSPTPAPVPVSVIERIDELWQGLLQTQLAASEVGVEIAKSMREGYAAMLTAEIRAALNHTPASLADLQRLGQEFDAAEANPAPLPRS